MVIYSASCSFFIYMVTIVFRGVEHGSKHLLYESGTVTLCTLTTLDKDIYHFVEYSILVRFI